MWQEILTTVFLVIILKDDGRTEKFRNDFGPKPSLHTIGNFIKVIVNSTLHNPGSGLSILCGPPFIWHWRRLELNNNLQDTTGRLWQLATKFTSTTDKIMVFQYIINYLRVWIIYTSSTTNVPPNPICDGPASDH